MKIFSCIRSLDFLGSSISFNINSYGSFKTIQGGFICFLIYIAYLYFFVIFGENYILKKNPSGYSQIIHSSQETKALKITNDSFFIGFQIYDNDGNVLRIEDYLHPIFTFREVLVKNGIFINKRIELKAKSCGNVNSSNIDTSFYNLTKFYCPDFSELKNADLQGDFSSEKSNMIEFYLSICDRNISNCKNTTKIKELAKGPSKWISTVIPIVKYDINNNIKSFSLELKNFYNLISPFKSIYEELRFAKYESESDFGNIFPEIVKEQAIGLEKRDIFEKPVTHLPETKEITKEYNFNELYLYKGIIMFENHKFYYSRWYLKLPDVVANVAGIIDLIVLCVTFFYSYFSRFSLNKYLSSQLIFVEEDPKNLRKNFETLRNEVNKINPMENIFNNSNLCKDDYRAFPLENNDKSKMELKEVIKEQNENQSERENIQLNKISRMNKIFESLVEKFKNPSNFFDFNYLDFLRSLFFNKDSKIKKKSELLEKISEKIEERLDVCNYIILSNKVNILQNVTFSFQQKKIIKLLSKKKYRVNSDCKMKEKSNLEEEGNKDILEYFLHLNRDKNDQKIIECFIGKE